jgi:hypothetical protein
MQVVVEMAFEARVADLQEPRERGAPALLEDRAVQPFDVPVGLWSAGADLGVRDTIGQSFGEGAASELVAVVAEHPLKLPARLLEVFGDAPGERRRVLDGRPGGRIAATTTPVPCARPVRIGCR